MKVNKKGEEGKLEGRKRRRMRRMRNDGGDGEEVVVQMERRERGDEMKV